VCRIFGRRPLAGARRKPPRDVAAELNEMAALGVRDVTFADEDLLGGDLAAAEKFVDGLSSGKIDYPRMDASLTVPDERRVLADVVLADPTAPERDGVLREERERLVSELGV
jgi:hypothetical protein